LRLAGAVVILAVLAGSAVLLAPAYWRNLRLQQQLEGMVSEPDLQKRPDEQLRVSVAGMAASLGIRLRQDEVRIDRTGGRFRVEAKYVVRVDIPVYTVDLHFRAASGAK
jgi:hypothetical protein